MPHFPFSRRDDFANGLHLNTWVPADSLETAHLQRLPGTPDLLRLHESDPERYPYLLESLGGSASLGRHDILFAFPGETLTLSADWRLHTPRGQPGPGDFLRTLDDWWSHEHAPDTIAHPVPFRGGWFVFLAYELAQQIEPGLRLEADRSCPVAKAVRVPAAIIRDHDSGAVFAVAEEGRAALLQQIDADLRRIDRIPAVRASSRLPLVRAGSVHEDDPEVFLAAVLRAQRHIAAGDIYQANISRQWRGQLEAGAEPATLYEQLRSANPAPFAGLALFDGVAVLSSSPERLLRVRSGRVETRPIAGTRPRINPCDPDHARRQELIANPKERAEHVMLIDLERNDLGRVCRAGSIRVDEFMGVESYAHVHHIVSNVSGDLRPGTRPGDVLRAVFPGGTITGCPKVRCISLIRELEGRPRGVYTGAMGYLNHDGSCDFNILIRTIVMHGREFSFNAGSGIVADSDPQRELEETRAKAKGMLLSLRD